MQGQESTFDLKAFLLEALGEARLEKIMEELIQVLCQNGLQRSPKHYQPLLRYLSGAMDCWNENRPIVPPS